jgi:hypothetical protein
MTFNVLFYAKMTDGAAKRLRRVIEVLVLKENTEIYRTIDSLSRRLRQPRNDLPVAVLLAASREDLLELLSIGDLLDGIRIILVLPDRENGTIAKGHRLQPCFLTYADGDFLDVAAVLIKMQGNAYGSSNTN